MWSESGTQNGPSCVNSLVLIWGAFYGRAVVMGRKHWKVR